jgi:hypothetical protein
MKITTKIFGILDGLKLSRNCKKLSGKKSRRFQAVQKKWVANPGYGQFEPNRPELILDGLGKPSIISSRRFRTKLSRINIYI